MAADLAPSETTAGTAPASLLKRVEKEVLPLLPAASCAFMLYSSGTAIYDSKGDPDTVAFVAGSLSILGALYISMHEFEKAAARRDTTKKGRLKLVIGLLSMSLNALFSYRVTSVTDSAISSVVTWCIAGATTIIGCYIMFCA